jgi:hypothetical protein
MKLSENAKTILNNEYFMEKKTNWMTRLNNLFNGKSDPYLDEYVFVLDGIEGSSGCDLYKNPEEWIIGCLEDLASKIEDTKKEFTFVPACVSYPLYGVHFVDKIFGANVFFKDDQWWSDYIKTPVGKLSMPDLDNNEVFSLAKKACLVFLDQNVKLPFFGLPTIASALNIGINLYGQEILIAMMTDKEAVKHDLRVIQDVLIALHKWYQEFLPVENLQPVIPAQRTQPYNYGQICGCSTALISADCYNEFIEPLDAELLGTYEHGGMIHLCGSHLQHIKSFQKMKELRAVQVNDRAAHDLETYYTELRKDQILYLAPCREMTVEKTLKITGGNRLVIQGDQGGPVKKPKPAR